MRILLLLITLLFSLIELQSQNVEKIASLKKMGRESLIQLAIKKLNNPKFDRNGYDRILVKAYDDKLVVEFKLSVLVKTGCFYDAVYVSLAGSGDSASIQGECEEPVYHKFSNSEKKKIKFVFDSINKSEEIGHINDNKLLDDEQMQIVEEPNYFWVEMDNKSTHSSYKVNKKTGKISDASHKHYARSKKEKPDYQLIK